MGTIDNGWTDCESMHVDGYNTKVGLAVNFAGGIPDRVSVVTDDQHGGISAAAVKQALASLGFAAESIAWEAGERENEDVAFLRGVAAVQS